MARLVKNGRIGLTIAVLVLVATLFAYVGLRGPAIEGTSASSASGASLERSSRASDAEGEITRANLGGRVEAALGDTFAGLWFEPSTAQMDVGVVSRASARLAEAAAAEAGLSELVAEIPVESTWAVLDAAQERWDRRLADLLGRGEAATALVAHRNAVSIELGSAVPAARRAELERAAAADGVEVSVTVAPYPSLAVKTLAQCEAFKSQAAVCEPTIVGGVTIHGPWVKPVGAEEEEGEFEIEAEPSLEETEEEGQQTVRVQCTAGPTAIKENPADKNEATKTYVLTAGHCINEKEHGGGVGGKWTAYNKMGIPKGANELGAAAAYLDDETDVGAIEVKTGYWAKANTVNPVVPGIARLDAGESDPLPVIDKRKPMEKAKTCMSGQITGRKCGEVVTTDRTLKAGKVTVKNLVEVKGAAAVDGDSGAPWYAEDEYKNGKAFVEGVLVGQNKKTKNVVTHSLETAFAELSKEKGLSLELLTTKNEKRHKPMVSTESSPATIDGQGSTEQILKRASSTVSCKGSTLSGSVANGAQTVTLTPTYTECSALTGLPATFTMNECAYVFHLEVTGVVEGVDQFAALTDLDCPAGKEAEIDIYANSAAHAAGTVLCRLSLGETGNQGLATVSLTNKAASGETPKDWVEAHVDVEGIDSKRTGSILCGAVENSAGTLEGSVRLKGTTGGGSATGITADTG